MTAPGADRDVFEVRPATGWPGLGLGELWARRGLLGFLVWRDVKIRYAQTLLGIAWVVLQPLGTMLIFTVVFGRISRIPSDGVPYAAFALVAIVAWSAFATGLTSASQSLVDQVGLIGKVYFPRLYVPMAPVAASLIDAAVAVTLLLPVLALLGLVPRVAPMLALPFFFLLGAITATGVGAGLAALNLRYRDFRYLVPFLVQAWMFVSPVVYPTSLVPARYQALYALNPMVGVIEGCRWALLGTPRPGAAVLAASVGGALLLLAAGLHYFRWAERTFVDVA